MTTKKKGVSGLAYPLAVIALGLFLILTKKGSYKYAAPVVEGPLVVFIGILFCLFGVWGAFRTIQENKKGPNQTTQHNAGSRPPPDDSSASGTPSSLGPRG